MSTKQNARSTTTARAKTKPRMSKSAARAEGAAKTDRLRKAALAEIKDRMDGKPAAPVKGKGEKPAKEPKATRVSGLDLAARILAEAGEPLNARTIAERAVAAGWTTSGKTPHATLYAAMIREIAAKGDNARFHKTDRGLFIAGEKA